MINLKKILVASIAASFTAASLSLIAAADTEVKTKMQKLSENLSQREENNVLDGAMPCRGKANLLFVNITFEGQDESYTTQEIDQMIFGEFYSQDWTVSPDQNLVDYFNSISYGKLEVGGKVKEYVLDTPAISDYDIDYSAILDEVLDGEDLSYFDQNNDNYLDGVVFFYPDASLPNGSSGYCTRYEYINGEYSTAQICALFNPNSFDVYTIAHEMVHLMGLPDIYANVSINPNGTCSDSIMNGQAANTSSEFGCVPSDLPGIMKFLFGWFDNVQYVYSNGDYKLKSYCTNSDAMVIYPNGNTESNFIFFVEYMTPENHHRSYSTTTYFMDGGLRIWQADMNIDENYDIKGNSTAIGCGNSPYIYLEALNPDGENWLLHVGTDLTSRTNPSSNYSDTYYRANDDAYKANQIVSGIELTDMTASDGIASFTINYNDSIIATPDFVTAKNCKNGIEIKWSPIDEAKGYHVYKLGEDYYYTKIATIENGATHSYIDTAVSDGVKYTYAIAAYRDDMDGGYNKGIEVTKSDCLHPNTEIEITAPTCTQYGYTLYTCTDCSVSYKDDHRPLTDHDYVDGICNCGNTNVDFNAPEITYSYVENDALTLEWNAVNGATSYRIYRAADATASMTLLDTVSSTSYTDISVESGNSYYYYIKAYSSRTNTLSEYSQAVYAIIPITPDAPVIVSATASGTTVNLKWNAVDGATSYKVYRATSATGEKTLLKTVGITSCNDTTVTAGNTYYYFVQAYNSNNGTRSDYSLAASVDIVAGLGKPTVSSVTQAKGKINIAWSAVDGATSYKVYRATSATGTKTLLKTVSTTSCTDTTAAFGTTYYYFVQAYNSTKGITSAYSHYKSLKFTSLAPPTLNSVTASGNTVNLSWSAVPNATSYRVYRGTSATGAKSLLKTVSTTSCNNTSVTAGTTYYYYVVAYSSKTGTMSAASNTKSVTIAGSLSAPTLSSVTQAKGKVNIAWNAVSGATSYRVYRATSATGTKTLLKTVGITSCEDSTAALGTTYYYFVQAYSSKTGASSAYSGYKSLKFTSLAPPTLNSVTKSGNTVNLSWTAVPNATSYRIYRGTSATGAKSLLKTVGITSCNNTSVTAGTTYYYYVVAYSSKTGTMSAASNTKSIKV